MPPRAGHADDGEGLQRSERRDAAAADLPAEALGPYSVAACLPVDRIPLHYRLMFGRHAKPDRIEPSEWPARSGKSRVLIENPDRADLLAHADILREAGYDVAICSGPTEAEGERACSCPLLEGQGCSLVDGADAVVSTASLTHSHDILAALSATGSLPIVFEASGPDLDRFRDVAGSATLLPQPVTDVSLRRAVAEAEAGKSPQTGPAPD